MTHRYRVFIREHQIVRFSIEVETPEDLRAALVEARQEYARRGTLWCALAETEIDSAEIFAVDELDPDSESVTQSFEFEAVSAAVDAPLDVPN